MQEKIIPPEPQVHMMRFEDMEAVIEIDTKVFGKRRQEYDARKMALAIDEVHQLVTYVVIEVEGKVAGFIMGEVYLGEFGMPEPAATIDTIGVDPQYQGRGVGSTLFEEFASHLRKIGVQSISTRVNWNDWNLLRFFKKAGFSPSTMIDLEITHHEARFKLPCNSDSPALSLGYLGWQGM